MTLPYFSACLFQESLLRCIRSVADPNGMGLGVWLLSVIGSERQEMCTLILSLAMYTATDRMLMV